MSLLQDNWEDARAYLKEGIRWKKAPSNTLKMVYVTEVEGMSWAIRMNNFPDEPLFTLIDGGCEIIHFNDWPLQWVREK